MDRCGIRESKTLDNMGTAKFEEKIESWVIGMTRGTKSSINKDQEHLHRGKDHHENVNNVKPLTENTF
jgi:hypothetical protein